MSKSAAPRKPRSVEKADYHMNLGWGEISRYAVVQTNWIDADQARIIAAWLLKYAAWAEHQKKGKKK